MSARTRIGLLAAVLAAVLGLAVYLRLATPWFQPAPDAVASPKHCNVCGSEVTFRRFHGRPDAVCSRCGAAERHRLLVHYLSHEVDLLGPDTRVLHFAPNPGVEAFFRAKPGLHYRTADLFKPEDLRLDLTAIDQPDASWDLVIVYHVLEHVPDDRAAAAELFRVLAPGGTLIVQVPLERDRPRTYADPRVTKPEHRLLHFGQEDHLRRYGSEDFRALLERAGFEVEAVDYLARLDPTTVAEHQLGQSPDSDGPLADERIWVARKPAR